MKNLPSVAEEPGKAELGELAGTSAIKIFFFLPDSDPSEGLALTLSEEESPLSGFRLKPIKSFWVV